MELKKDEITPIVRLDVFGRDDEVLMQAFAFAINVANVGTDDIEDSVMVANGRRRESSSYEHHLPIFPRVKVCSHPWEAQLASSVDGIA
jgi:hypothetical protein